MAENGKLDPQCANHAEAVNDITLRVGKIEGVVESLSEEVKQTTSSVRDLVQNISAFKEDVLAHIGKATAPRWPLITAVSSLVGTILVLMGTLIAFLFSSQSDVINNNAGRLDFLNEKVHATQFEVGGMQVQHNHLSSKIEELDAKLQMEMKLMHDENNARLDILTREVEKMDSWQQTNDTISNRERARLAALVEVLLQKQGLELELE